MAHNPLLGKNIKKKNTQVTKKDKQDKHNNFINNIFSVVVAHPLFSCFNFYLFVLVRESYISNFQEGYTV